MKRIQLTEDQIKLFTKAILQCRNKVQACKFASVHWNTFDNAMTKGGALKESQVMRLMEFCGV